MGKRYNRSINYHNWLHYVDDRLYQSFNCHFLRHEGSIKTAEEEASELFKQADSDDSFAVVKDWKK